MRLLFLLSCLLPLSAHAGCPAGTWKVDKCQCYPLLPADESGASAGPDLSAVPLPNPSCKGRKIKVTTPNCVGGGCTKDATVYGGGASRTTVIDTTTNCFGGGCKKQ